MANGGRGSPTPLGGGGGQPRALHPSTHPLFAAGALPRSAALPITPGKGGLPAKEEGGRSSLPPPPRGPAPYPCPSPPGTLGAAVICAIAAAPTRARRGVVAPWAAGFRSPSATEGGQTQSPVRRDPARPWQRARLRFFAEPSPAPGWLKGMESMGEGGVPPSCRRQPALPAATLR